MAEDIVVNTGKSDEFDLYYEAAEDLYLHRLNSPADFIEDLRAKVSLAYNSLPNDNAEAELWRLESAFWHLLETLHKARSAHPSDGLSIPPLNPEISNTELRHAAAIRYPRLRDLSAVTDWLRALVPKPRARRPEQLGAMKAEIAAAAARRSETLFKNSPSNVSFGLSAFNGNGNGNGNGNSALLSEYHCDVFLLLLAGEFADALGLCRAVEDAVLASAIQTWLNYQNFDPSVSLHTRSEAQTAGESFRTTCAKIALSPGADKYENAIYGLLANVADAVIPVCNSWNLRLLAKVSEVLTSFYDMYIASLGTAKLSAKTVTLGTLCGHAGVSFDGTSATDAFVAAYVALVDDTVAQETERLLKMPKTTLRDRLVRVFTALLLFLSETDPEKLVGSAELSAPLLKEYVEILAARRKYLLIPLYYSTLSALTNSESGPEDLYAGLLSQVDSLEERRSMIEISSVFKIDLRATLQLTMDNLLRELRPEYLPADPMTVKYAEAASESDMRLVNCVRLFLDANMPVQSVYYAVEVYRLFLFSGRLVAAVALGSAVPTSEIFRAYDKQILGLGDSGGDGVAELPATLRLEIEQITAFIDHVVLCDELLETLISGKRVFTIGDMREFIAAFRVFVTRQLFFRLSISRDAEVRGIAGKMRALYVSYVFDQLHSVYRIAVQRDRKLTGCWPEVLQLAEVVADERYKLYISMDEADKLKAYLQQVSEFSLEALRAEEA